MMTHAVLAHLYDMVTEKRNVSKVIANQYDGVMTSVETVMELKLRRIKDDTDLHGNRQQEKLGEEYKENQP